MNPEKLFDYLEGTLPEQERIKLEQQLATDPQLQRQLAIARTMDRRSYGSREVLGESENVDIPAPTNKLGGRLAAAFAFLMLINVLVGIAFIVGKKRSNSPNLETRERALRQELSASLQKTAETALPLPTLATHEIRLVASEKEQDTMANNVVMLAQQSGGSATKAPPDESGITVLAELPGDRVEEFRKALAPIAQADFSSSVAKNEKLGPNDKVNIYVRITPDFHPPGQ